MSRLIRLRQFRFYLFGGALLFAGCAGAQNYLQPLGVEVLRSTTTNLNGAGITVAQVEAGYGATTNWQVSPFAVGQPTNRFTYIYNGVTATNFPNSLGGESRHADDVAIQFYGYTNGVATNVARIYNYEANDFWGNYVSSTPTHTANAAIINQSFTFGEQTMVYQQLIDSDYDNYSLAYKTLFISAANNYGTSAPSTTNVVPPGTAYNCICVGAYKDGNSYNSLGPTLDNRCKPDITALSDAVSYTTPQVAGAAAVMLQAALRGDGGSDTNSPAQMQTIKALLLNGAVKPTNWTNSATSPLDARYGAGILNLFNSYKLLAGGKHLPVVSNSVSLNAVHPPTGATGTVSVLSGWDFNTNTSSTTQDRIHHYYFDATNGTANYLAMATLVWNRQANKSAINDLNLFLYNCANSNLIASSTSLVDNVEHIYTTNLAPGRYDLQVWKAGGVTIVSTAETYALAWQFVQPPVLAMARGTNAVLAWPVYPAGFVVETGTNLLSGSWVTNGVLSTSITNGTNQVQFPATNGSQFFRLRRP